jgi:predicted RNA-binding protein (virulence factor B family)
MDDFATSSHFGNLMDFIDFLLGDRSQNYVNNLQKNLALKLSLHSMEMNELNIFLLLISNAFDSLIEYTNESLNKKKLLPLSYGEFRKIIGTLLLSSVFNSSVDQSWKMMGSLMKDKNITIYTDFKQSLRLRHETMNN